MYYFFFIFDSYGELIETFKGRFLVHHQIFRTLPVCNIMDKK